MEPWVLRSSLRVHQVETNLIIPKSAFPSSGINWESSPLCLVCPHSFECLGSRFDVILFCIFWLFFRGGPERMAPCSPPWVPLLYHQTKCSVILCTLLLKFDTRLALEQLRSQPNDSRIPKSSKYNISICNGPIAFKFYTEVKYQKLHKKNGLSKTRLTPKLHSLTTLVSTKSFKCNISMNNGPIALKFCTAVQSQ